jgi:hypothetical protein
LVSVFPGTLIADGVVVVGGGGLRLLTEGFRRRLLGGVCGASGTLNELSSEVAAFLFFAWLAVLRAMLAYLYNGNT